MTHATMLVTARMAEPVITYDDGMHLDGILAMAAYRDLSEEARWALQSITEPWALDFDLPLARWSVAGDTPPGSDARLRDDTGRVWGWLATRALARVERRGTHEIRKRVPTEETVRWSKAKTVHAGLGPAKAYDLKLPTIWAHQIHWLAIGDLAEVLRLLDTHMYGIGKHCAKGLGRVLEWRVDPAPGVDAAFICSHRRMPSLEGTAQSLATIRPPYHHNSRVAYARDPVIGEPVVHPATGEVLAS